MKFFIKLLLFVIISVVPITANKDRCSKDYGHCDSNDCCSLYNWCGTTEDLCGNVCQSENSNVTMAIKQVQATQNGQDFDFLKGVKSKNNYGQIPDGDQQVEFVNKMKRNFNKDSKQTVIVIVSQNVNIVINIFGFPAQKGFYKTYFNKI